MMEITWTNQTKLSSTIPAWLMGIIWSQHNSPHRIGYSWWITLFVCSAPLAHAILFLVLSPLPWSWYFVVCSVRRRSWQRVGREETEKVLSCHILRHTVIIFCLFAYFFIPTEVPLSPLLPSSQFPLPASSPPPLQKRDRLPWISASISSCS